MHLKKTVRNRIAYTERIWKYLSGRNWAYYRKVRLCLCVLACVCIYVLKYIYIFKDYSVLQVYCERSAALFCNCAIWCVLMWDKCGLGGWGGHVRFRQWRQPQLNLLCLDQSSANEHWGVCQHFCAEAFVVVVVFVCGTLCASNKMEMEPVSSISYP